MLKFRCGQCHQKIGVPESYAGRLVRCPRCGQPARVPEDAVDPEPPPHFASQDIPEDFGPESTDSSEDALPPGAAKASESGDISAPHQSQETSEALEEHIEPQAASEGAGADAREESARPAPARGFSILGIVSLLAGAAAIGLCWCPPEQRLALPVGGAALALGVCAVIVSAAGRRSGLKLPVFAVLISLIAVALPILAERHLLPGTWRLAVGREHASAPTGIAPNGVDVRVASAAVLRPAAYAADFHTLQTAADCRLRLTLELRRVGGSGAVAYHSWSQQRGDLGPKLTASSGQRLQAIDLSPLTPVGQLKSSPVVLRAGGPAARDVLLFEAPSGQGQDLLLELPADNIGSPGATLQIRIPAAQILWQRLDAARAAS